jgi:hypothetical protein
MAAMCPSTSSTMKFKSLTTGTGVIEQAVFNRASKSTRNRARFGSYSCGGAQTITKYGDFSMGLPFGREFRNLHRKPIGLPTIFTPSPQAGQVPVSSKSGVVTRRQQALDAQTGWGFSINHT